MPYEITNEIARFLPPDPISVYPLEFDWQEATNAIVFTSGFDKESFSDWEECLSAYYKALLGDIPDIDVESDPELGCATFWINLDPDHLPEGAISVDVGVARCCVANGFENLNAWIGSSRLTDMVEKDKPAMVGLIRIRPMKS